MLQQSTNSRSFSFQTGLDRSTFFGNLWSVRSDLCGNMSRCLQSSMLEKCRHPVSSEHRQRLFSLNSRSYQLIVTLIVLINVNVLIVGSLDLH